MSIDIRESAGSGNRPHLIVDGRPTNLRLPAGARAEKVDSDVWHVCDQIEQKFGDRVYIVVSDDGSGYPFTAMEHADNGEDFIIKKYAELTPEVVGDLDFMLRIDLKQRMRILEKENEKWEKDWREREEEQMYEEVGRPMWTELERAGFITRPVSYPKTGVTGGHGSRSKTLPRNLTLP